MEKNFRAKIVFLRLRLRPSAPTPVLTQNKGPDTEPHFSNPPSPLLRRASMLPSPPPPPPQSNCQVAQPRVGRPCRVSPRARRFVGPQGPLRTGSAGPKPKARTTAPTTHTRPHVTHPKCMSPEAPTGAPAPPSMAHPQGRIRREGASVTAPEAVRQAVGGGCQSGWGRLLSVTNAVEASACRQGDSGWASAGRPGRGGGGGGPPPLPLHRCPPTPHVIRGCHNEKKKNSECPIRPTMAAGG